MSGQRMFFALWPTPGVAEQLDRLGRAAVAGCPGRRVLRQSLHLTLAFLGTVDPLRAEEVTAAAHALRAPVFDLALDRLVWRRRQGIVWLQASRLPVALTGLVEHLAQGLAAIGFPPEARAFVAHVSLLRGAHAGAPPAIPGQAILWSVHDFVLVASQLHPGGARYRILQRWPLLPLSGGAARE